MCKRLLTIFVILISFNVALAASAKGRMRMVVVRTNVQPADINVVKNKTSFATVEIIY